MGLGACATTSEMTVPPPQVAAALEPLPAVVEEPSASATPPRHGPRQNERFPVPAEDLARVPQKYQRQLVDFPTEHAPGTIVVDPNDRVLYLVQADGKALRYGVGVGAAGRGFSGTSDLAYKQEWPRWRPTDSMIARAPERYKQHENGVEGGPGNPLGARALYLFKDGKDTYYRIHGTNQPGSIGKAVSAGCIRMLNHDVIDLYERVRTGAKVVVL
ncbi:L,D-transpeptidase [Pseudaminobacter sp. 19-2017]|uniref:L,D-transpeptidase n=2 Tax=Pseudaminobacter soli (ex Zhang et al. 2022) TaxID=2831468 RepID=A0A942I6G5_9HYPH|nr:L,D-transpeptidase [Pseudaminobacter soli]